MVNVYICGCAEAGLCWLLLYTVRFEKQMVVYDSCAAGRQNLLMSQLVSLDPCILGARSVELSNHAAVLRGGTELHCWLFVPAFSGKDMVGARGSWVAGQQRVFCLHQAVIPYPLYFVLVASRQTWCHFSCRNWQCWMWCPLSCQSKARVTVLRC